MSFPFKIKLYLLAEERAVLRDLARTLPNPIPLFLQPVTSARCTDRTGTYQCTVPTPEVAQELVDAFEAEVQKAPPFSHQWRVSNYMADSLRHFTAFRGGVSLHRALLPVPELADRARHDSAPLAGGSPPESGP